MMKTYFLFIFLISIIHAPLSMAKRLSIQTLNTYNTFYAKNRTDRNSLILEFLKKDNGDINFLQEVWFEKDYQDIEKTSKSIGMKSIFYNSSSSYKKQSGLVTILDGHISNKNIHFFHNTNSLADFVYSMFRINKGFGVAYVTHPKVPDIPFWAVNVHLHHFSQEIRLVQLVHYFRWFLDKKSFNDPVIFAGDFNFEPNSLEFDMIRYMFRFNEPQSHLKLKYNCTLCSENTTYIGHNLWKISPLIEYEKTTDYIFFKSSPTAKLTPEKFRIFPKKYQGKFLSDHYGVRTILKFEKRKSHHPSITKKELDQRIQKFSSTLRKVKTKMRLEFSKEQRFLNTLLKELKKPNSSVIRHLQQN